MSKNTVIFDLDGTIALVDKRRNLSKKPNGKIDWDIFFNSKNIELDEPNKAVIKTLQLYKKNNYRIVILSGRLETTKEATLAWLSGHNVYFDEIKMRKNTPLNKYVSDVELKEKWLDEIGVKNILCVYDDRDKLVQMWRNKGLICFQVAEGNF